MQTQMRSYRGKSYLVATLACTGRKVSKYPIVFFGGAAMSVEKLDSLLNNFAKFADVYAIDLPGFGQSDILSDKYGLEFYRDLLFNFTLNFGLEKVNLIGSSYGSAPAILFSFAHPHRVNKLVGVGTMATIPEMWRDRFKRLVSLSTDENKKEEFADCFTQTIISKQGMEKVRKSAILYKSVRKMVLKLTDQERQAFRYNTLRLLNHKMPKLNGPCPVDALLCTGEYDHFTSMDRIYELAQYFERPETCTIQNAGHMVHIEQTEVVMDMISSFLEGVGIGHVKGLCENEMIQIV